MKLRVLVLMGCSALLAQDPDAPTLRITVTMVQVDAVVTDRGGKHVPDLTRDDFEVFEDGKAQKISHFSFVPGQAPIQRKTTASGLKGAPVTATVPGGLKASAENTRRTMALVVDDLGLTFASTHSVREELRRFVDEKVQPGDLVAILRTGAGIGALQQFTTDKRVLYAAIDRIRWNIRSRTGPFTFAGTQYDPNGVALKTEVSSGDHTSEWTRNSDEELRELQRQVSSVGTLGALNYVIRGLAKLPGRKAVVLFSDGFKIYSTPKDHRDRRARDSTKILEQLRAVTDQANRSGVVIYAIDAKGLVYPGITASDDTTVPGFDENQLMSDRMDEIEESWDGLHYLATHTGGMWFRNSNDISGMAAKAVDDVAGYYLIGYSPEESSFKHDPGHTKFHRLRVRVKRPGMAVRTRRGFYGIPDSAQPTGPRPAGAQLADAIASPFDSGAIGLRLTTIFGNDVKSGSYLMSLLHLNAKDLDFAEEAGGVRHATVELLSYTYGDGLVPVDQRRSTYEMRVKAEDWPRVLERGVLYAFQHPAKKAGAYQVRVAVRDARSGQTGSASQFVQVPDVSKGALALSSIMMQSGKESEAAGAKGAESLGGAAMRRFRPDDAFYYALVVFNPGMNPETRKPDVEIQARVFRDGEPVWTGQAFSLSDSAPDDPRRVKVAQKLNFGRSAPAGEYFIEVVAVDKRSRKRLPVVQWMDFELRPDGE